jgi:hypothetical protein
MYRQHRVAREQHPIARWEERSQHIASLSASTACLLAAYVPFAGPPSFPASEPTLMMRPARCRRHYWGNRLNHPDHGEDVRVEHVGDGRDIHLFDGPSHRKPALLTTRRCGRSARA